MPARPYSLPRFLLCCAVASLLFSSSLRARSQEAPVSDPGPAPTAQPAAQPSPVLPPSANFDKAIFLKPIPSAQLAFLSQYAGAPTSDLYRDKQFRKLLHSALPDCTFHYGRDVPLLDAVDAALESSRQPVQLREGRYLMLSGRSPIYPGLGGNAMAWIDLQDGIVLGAFYFHPTNGEPTPAVNVFSRQVKLDFLGLSELPPEFLPDLGKWSYEARVPPVAFQYFITGNNKKILLEHDLDFCQALDGSTLPPASGCQQMAADAADMDMNAAYYLDQVHHATNATAWMITGENEVAFIHLRASSCAGAFDPLGCRVLITREHIHTITGAPHPHPQPRPKPR